MNLHHHNRIWALGVLLAAVFAAWIALPTLAQDAGLTEEEQAIWNDPDFRKRFVDSYAPLTDLEPKPTSEVEVEAINQTLELMRENKLEEALAFAIEARENPQPKPKETDRRRRSRDKEEDEEAAVVKMSALMDYLIANIQLNIAINIPEPGEDATERERTSYTIKRNKYYSDAAQGYYIATQRHPKYLRAWRNMGIAYLRLEDYRSARDALAKVIELGGAGPDIYGQLGFCHTVLEDHLAAESAYRMANLMQPDNPGWKQRLLRNFLMQKRYPEVVAMSSNMLETDPTNDTIWLIQANAYIGMDQIDKAAENYEILDGLGKSTPQTLSMLANIYTNKGLFGTAVERYAQALEMSDEAGRASMMPRLITAAQVLSNRGEQSREATRAMIALIEQTYGSDLEKKDRTTLLRIGARLALAEGADQEQAEILQQVVEIDPLDGEALLLLGQHYAREQDWDKAIFYYERAEKLEKVQADALVYHAQVLVNSQRPTEAVPLLRQSLQIKYRERVKEYLDLVEKMKK